MRLYRTVLNASTRNRIPPATRDRLFARLKRAFREGYWFCFDCDKTCDREEGEQGQPAHCERCKSPRIRWCPPDEPILVSQTEAVAVSDTVMIEPEDLR